MKETRCQICHKPNSIYFFKPDIVLPFFQIGTGRGIYCSEHFSLKFAAALSKYKKKIVIFLPRFNFNEENEYEFEFYPLKHSSPDVKAIITRGLDLIKGNCEVCMNQMANIAFFEDFHFFDSNPAVLCETCAAGHLKDKWQDIVGHYGSIGSPWAGEGGYFPTVYYCGEHRGPIIKVD